VGQRPDVVHVHAASHASFLRKSVVLLIARLAGCKTIFHLHGGGFRQFATVEAGPLMRRWIRHTLEASSLVITLSDGWAQFVHTFAPRARVAVVPNSVPLPALPSVEPPSPAASCSSAGWKRPRACSNCWTPARASCARRPARRRCAWCSAAKAMPGVRRRAAELGIADRIELPGWVGPEARDAELARASVFCLPSHAEGLPMSMLEAMAARKAVVASMWEVFRKPSSTATTACWCRRATNRRSPERWHDSWATTALRDRLAERARATIEQQYSTEVVCGQLSAIYRELAGTQ
jgi:glycosyltransferase involved in cell wall biosynthesis